MSGQCRYCQLDPFVPLADINTAEITGQQNYCCCCTTDNNSVHKHPYHLYKPLGGRMVWCRWGAGSDVGSTPHARLVREQTTSDPGLHRLSHSISHPTGSGLLPTEGAVDYQFENGRQLLNIHPDNDQDDQDISKSHNRYNYLGYPRNFTQPTHDDQATGDHQQNTYPISCFNVKPVSLFDIKHNFQCPRNGIGLNGIENQTKGDDQEYGEKNPHPALAKPPFHIIRRTATKLVIFIFYFIDLSQSRLNHGRSHTQQSDEPHPKNCTRATCTYGNGHPGHITGTDSCGHTGTKYLKWRQAAVTALSTGSHHLGRMPQVSELNEQKPQSEVQASAHQGIDQ